MEIDQSAIVSKCHLMTLNSFHFIEDGFIWTVSSNLMHVCAFQKATVPS